MCYMELYGDAFEAKPGKVIPGLGLKEYSVEEVQHSGIMLVAQEIGARDMVWWP